MRYYISSGFFTDETRKQVSTVAQIFRDAGYEVYVPMEYFVPDGENMAPDEWARKVFEKDVEELNKCDVVVVLDFGANGDCGTSWEAGYAYAMGIPYIVYAYGSDISLMVYCGADSVKSITRGELKLV